MPAGGMLSFVLSTPWPFSFITSKCLCNENCPFKIDTVIKIENESQECSLINRLDLSIHLSSENLLSKQAHISLLVSKEWRWHLYSSITFLSICLFNGEIISWHMLHSHCSIVSNATLQFIRKHPFRKRTIIKAEPSLPQQFIFLTDRPVPSKMLRACNRLT